MPASWTPLADGAWGISFNDPVNAEEWAFAIGGPSILGVAAVFPDTRYAAGKILPSSKASDSRRASSTANILSQDHASLSHPVDNLQLRFSGWNLRTTGHGKVSPGWTTLGGSTMTSRVEGPS